MSENFASGFFSVINSGGNVRFKLPNVTILPPEAFEPPEVLLPPFVGLL